MIIVPTNKNVISSYYKKKNLLLFSCLALWYTCTCVFLYLLTSTCTNHAKKLKWLIKVIQGIALYWRTHSTVSYKLDIKTGYFWFAAFTLTDICINEHCVLVNQLFTEVYRIHDYKVQ